MKAKFLLFLVTIISVASISVFLKFYLKQTQTPNYTALIDQKKDSVKPLTGEYSGWLAWWNEKETIDLLEKLQQTDLNTILPVWYVMEKDGTIIEDNRYKNKDTITNKALSKRIKIMPSIANEFDPEKVSNFLNDWQNHNQVIKSLVSEAKTKGYIGYDLDWEEVYEDDKKGFNDFISLFGESLHQEGLLLSVTVHPKTGQNTDSKGSRSQDWSEISKHADFIRIMIYDYHYSQSPPGPITPLDFYENVLKYAISTIPPEKINIGLATYGYDWSGNRGVPLQYNEIQNKIASLKASPKRDTISSEMTFTYNENGQKHEVWYEDSESSKAKVIIAKSFGINKFTFWRLGGEDPKLWNID